MRKVASTGFTFVEAYDREHYAMDDPPPPLETVRALMEHAGMNTTGLGELLGSKGLASEILRGRRPLSKSHMFKLAERFNVDPGLFLQRPARK
jgi:HTH-type transcriptional regulator/antitoxin HigA